VKQSYIRTLLLYLHSGGKRKELLFLWILTNVTREWRAPPVGHCSFLANASQNIDSEFYSVQSEIMATPGIEYPCIAVCMVRSR
jgi:hypothetical protein